MSLREETLEQLGYPVADAPSPAALYRPVAIDGTTIYCSGALPLVEGKLVSQGKVPSQIALEDAQKAAALCAANCLRMARKSLGSLDKIDRVVRVTGYVNSEPEFTDQHLVINGASQLVLDVFGEEAGLAARSAIGVAQLPLGASVELEMILRLGE